MALESKENSRNYNNNIKSKTDLKCIGEGQSLTGTSFNFSPTITEDHQTFESLVTCLKKLKKCFACSLRGYVAKFFTWILLIFLIWGCLVVLLGKPALPNGTVFSILALLLLAQLGGYFVSIFYLPPLLGMLIVGIILKSIPEFEIIGTNIDAYWSTILRKTALVIILMRAGLGLDSKALKNMPYMVIRLGVLPNLVEVATVSVVVHFFLDFPWLWSIMLGFILAGVSPSVVVPCILSISEAGYGVNKGISTLIIAGLSIDNIISLSGFGVMMGLIFSEGSITWQVLKGPLEVVIGLLYGCAMGCFCCYLPNLKERSTTKFQFSLLLSSGLLSLFGSIKVGFGGAGPIGCITTAFVAGVGLSRQNQLKSKSRVKESFNFLWQFFLPLLFGLIGTEIKISSLDGNIVWVGLITLLISLTLRISTTFFSVLGGNLTAKERLFVSLAWLPKATIQAAVGSTALDMARTMNDNDQLKIQAEILGTQVLTIAILVILIAAPIGASAIMLTAPKLLNKTKPKSFEEESDPNLHHHLNENTTKELRSINVETNLIRNEAHSHESSNKIKEGEIRTPG